MATIKRVIVSQAETKIDFTGLVPDAKTHPQIEEVTIAAPEAPALMTLSVGNTTVVYTGKRG